jgi:hypothetical protein
LKVKGFAKYYLFSGLVYYRLIKGTIFLQTGANQNKKKLEVNFCAILQKGLNKNSIPNRQFLGYFVL